MIRARTVLLASGVVDSEPKLPAFEQAVKRGLIRICPICDGYEVQGQAVGVIGNSDKGAREALFLRLYTDRLTLIHVGDPETLQEAERRELAEAGIDVIETPIGNVVAEQDRITALELGDAGLCRFDTLYSALGSTPCSGLADKLGAATDPAGCLQVSEHQETAVPGLYAAGDLVRGLNQISVAQGEAAIAATDIHNRLRAVPEVHEKCSAPAAPELLQTRYAPAAVPARDDKGMIGAGLMAGFGEGLKRLFATDARRGGLSHGDASLLELLDLNLLRREAYDTDAAAGRVGVKDRPQRLLEAAVVWREVARRTGDGAALRKSASAAELASSGFEKEGRSDCARRARRNQAYAAMLGADLFGEDGLNAAAEFVLTQSQDSPKTRGALARISARKVLSCGGVSEALSASARFDGPLAVLETRDKPAAARLRCERAEVLAGCGARLHDPLLFDMALKDANAALVGLDPAYRPLTWLHLQEVRGTALIGLGEAHADTGAVVDAVSILTAAADHLTPDHSPLDWARIHNVLGQGLAALGEAEACEGAFERALEQYGHALRVLRQFPSLALRAAVALNRAGCLVRRAEIAGDLYALDEAEAVFRGELACARPGRSDAASWAVLQMNLARVYVARAAVVGCDRGEARAGGRGARRRARGVQRAGPAPARHPRRPGARAPAPGQPQAGALAE